MVKNGLLESKHRKKMGGTVWLYMKILSLMGFYRDTFNVEKKEICVLVYPATVQKSLDIDQETFRSWMQLLEIEGYISSHYLQDKNAYVVCISKAQIRF